MKIGMTKSVLFFAAVLVIFTACKDRNAEKRIAELESRLAEVEGKKANVSPTLKTPEVKPEGPLPVMEFSTTDHDFGTIKEGDVVEYTYNFKNTGAAPLVIESAQGSCGCTASDWTKGEIPVGGSGFVKAKFDSNGKHNLQNKTVTITANTWPKRSEVRFKAMVIAKEPAPAK